MVGGSSSAGARTREFEPVNAHEACARLGSPTTPLPLGTLYSWVSRYGVRRVYIPSPSGGGDRVVYDYNDLLVIEREIRHRHPVPPTYALRARIVDVCPLALALREGG